MRKGKQQKSKETAIELGISILWVFLISGAVFLGVYWLGTHFIINETQNYQILNKAFVDNASQGLYYVPMWPGVYEAINKLYLGAYPNEIAFCANGTVWGNYITLESIRQVAVFNATPTELMREVCKDGEIAGHTHPDKLECYPSETDKKTADEQKEVKASVVACGGKYGILSVVGYGRN